MCLDKGYDDDEVRELLTELGFTAHIRARGDEAKLLKQDAGVRARRWVVERTHSWLNRFRRVLIRWDTTVRNDLGFLHLACADITYRQAGLVGEPLSHVLYYFESNTRSATILGVVGAGGIGLQLADRIRVNNWDEVGFL